MNADLLLLALRASNARIGGVHIGDPVDVASWRFDATPPLSPEETAAAEAVARGILFPTPSSATISKLDFLRILTPAEYADVRTRAAGGDATLTYALALLDASFQLTATERTFQQMLAYCVSVGVFSPDRAAAIVAAMLGT
jgi:hypothetical protein